MNHPDVASCPRQMAQLGMSWHWRQVSQVQDSGLDSRDGSFCKATACVSSWECVAHCKAAEPPGTRPDPRAPGRGSCAMEVTSTG